MRRSPASAVAYGASLAVAVMAAVVVHRFSPPPAADVARGTEEAFASGLQRRELPPRQAPIRWTGDRLAVAFERMPAGPANVDVEIAGHREDAIVSIDGVVAGTIPAGGGGARFALDVPGVGTHRVQIDVPPFLAGDGRRLGARLQHVTWTMGDRGAPGLALIALFALPALAAVAAARLAGLGAGRAIVVAGAVTLVHAALLWPSGLVRSPWALRQAVLVAVALVLASAFARWAESRRAGAAPWALAAALAALLVQGLLALSPVVVVSDAVFHANTLARVAGGDFFPTSVTQHARPFRFPYGVSFYALLAPLLRAGLDGVALVRAGAAVAGVAASAVAFLLLLRAYGPAAAGLAVVLLQLMPFTFDVAFSYGNLSNGFGQDATVAFFAWWAGTAPWGAPLGAVLLALAATAHFSSLVVAAVLGIALAVGRRGAHDRARMAAVVAGLAIAALYYAHFAGLIVTQLPRLGEGGGISGLGVGHALRRQVMMALLGFGVPAVILAVIGRPRPRAQGDAIVRALDRDLAAFWAACGLLAVPAILSPLEVRYLYALSLPLAAAAGRGAATLHARGGPRRYFGWTLVGAQALIGATNLWEAVFSRYRP